MCAGGYVEEASGRRVTNDVWCLDPEDGWLLMQPDEGSESRPGPRLCSASCVVDGKLLLFAGWDPETAGTGGKILDDVWSLDLETLEWTQLEAMPRGPVSRHVAVRAKSGCVVVHTFRCLESVLVFEDGRWVDQPTTGEAPSSRGLHSAAAVGDDVVVFGGADKSGDMRCDAFALDTRTWTWRRLADQGGGPSPRAGSCAAALGDDLFIVACGAERGPLGDLVPRADAWALHLASGQWTELAHQSSAVLSRRNAASLSGPLLRTVDADDDAALSFALHGGWHPFKKTFGDTVFLDLLLSEDD